MNINEIIKFNSVIVIQSLPSGEKETGKILVEELKKHHSPETIELKKIKNSGELNLILSNIKENMLLNPAFTPIINIETHGCEQGIGFADRSFMEWAELMDQLRELNRLRNNQLIVCLSCCFGITYLRQLQISKYSSCGHLIAPKVKISPSEILSSLLDFFNGILTEELASLDIALERLPKDKFDFFRSEEFFLNALTWTIINYENKKNGIKDEVKKQLEMLINSPNSLYFRLNESEREGFLNAQYERVDSYMIDWEKFIAGMSYIFLGEDKEGYANHVVECARDYISKNSEE